LKKTTGQFVVVYFKMEESMNRQKVYVIILLCIMQTVHASDCGSGELTEEQSVGLLKMQ